jgi:hypothetical protein
MDSWSFTVCLPELLLAIALVGIVGFFCWILGEQQGWEEGFIVGCDLREEELKDLLEDEIATDEQ